MTYYGAAVLTFLKTTFFLFRFSSFFVVSLPSTTQQNILPFFCYNFLLSFYQRKSRRWHILPNTCKDLLDMTNNTIILLFANFELHCDSYTFSLRLNLKQLK